MPRPPRLCGSYSLASSLPLSLSFIFFYFLLFYYIYIYPFRLFFSLVLILFSVALSFSFSLSQSFLLIFFVFLFSLGKGFEDNGVGVSLGASLANWLCLSRIYLAPTIARALAKEALTNGDRSERSPARDPTVSGKVLPTQALPHQPAGGPR